MAAVAMPLEPMARIVVPQDEVPTDWHTNEPPSIYLRRRARLGERGDAEEYSVAFDELTSRSSIGVIAVRYSAYRDRDARLHGWEYTRALWFEQFGPDAGGGVVN